MILQLTVRRGDERKRRASTTLEGVRYTFVYQYVAYTDSWVLDVLDDADVPIVVGLRLALGVDLFAGFHHLALPPGKLVAYDTDDTEIEAGLDGFDERVILVYAEGDA